MNAFVAVLLSFFMTLASTATLAAEHVLLSCEPARIQAWPANASIQIIRTNNALLMQVRSQYYGFTFQDDYPVTYENHTYSGEGITLRIAAQQPGPKGFEAQLYSAKHGSYKMICR